MENKTALERYEEIVESLITLHKKYSDSHIDAQLVQHTALEILKQEVAMHMHTNW